MKEIFCKMKEEFLRRYFVKNFLEAMQPDIFQLLLMAIFKFLKNKSVFQPTTLFFSGYEIGIAGYFLSGLMIYFPVGCLRDCIISIPRSCHILLPCCDTGRRWGWTQTNVHTEGKNINVVSPSPWCPATGYDNL
jgi:hypothetical protein